MTSRFAAGPADVALLAYCSDISGCKCNKNRNRRNVDGGLASQSTRPRCTGVAARGRRRRARRRRAGRAARSLDPPESRGRWGWVLSQARMVATSRSRSWGSTTLSGLRKGCGSSSPTGAILQGRDKRGRLEGSGRVSCIWRIIRQGIAETGINQDQHCCRSGTADGVAGGARKSRGRDQI